MTEYDGKGEILLQFFANQCLQRVSESRVKGVRGGYCVQFAHPGCAQICFGRGQKENELELERRSARDLCWSLRLVPSYFAESIFPRWQPVAAH